MQRLRWRRDSPDHKLDKVEAAKAVVGKLSRRLKVRVLPGAPLSLATLELSASAENSASTNYTRVSLQNVGVALSRDFDGFMKTYF